MKMDLFDDLVVKDSKGLTTSEEAESLRSPENLQRWIESLIRQRANAQAHISSRRARLSQFAGECGVGKKGKTLPSIYLDRKREFEQQSQGGRRFIGALSERLDEAKQLAREFNIFDAPSLFSALMKVRLLLGDDRVDDSQECIEAVLARLRD